MVPLRRLILKNVTQIQYKLQRADYGNISVDLAQKIFTTHQVPSGYKDSCSHVGYERTSANHDLQILPLL